MKKMMTLLMALVLMFAVGSIMVYAGTGPAPNSGDGISDGSGFDSPAGPSSGTAGAPNSGDSTSDGSGW